MRRSSTLPLGARNVVPQGGSSRFGKNSSLTMLMAPPIKISAVKAKNVSAAGVMGRVSVHGVMHRDRPARPSACATRRRDQHAALRTDRLASRWAPSKGSARAPAGLWDGLCSGTFAG